MLSETLSNLLDVAERQLKLEPPLLAWVLLNGVDGFRLAVDPQKYHQSRVGQLLQPQVEERVEIGSYGHDIDSVLRPFFEKIYDKAGRERPAEG